MPIYEYRCEECGENFEHFVRTAQQRSEPTCPRCESTKVKKAISLFGVGSTSGSGTASAACGPSPV